MAAVSAAQYGVGALVTAVMHPVGYAKVLIQVGHEPLAPQPSVSLLGKESWVYPNVFQYISHIKKVDGFFGLYRGVFPKVLAGSIGSAVQNSVSEKLKGMHVLQTVECKSTNEDELVLWLKNFCRETLKESCGRSLGIIVSHPFHVIMVRSMVQFVGGETQYNNIFSSIGEIYRSEGILGFFGGLVPRLLGEVITVWISSFLAQLLNKYIVEEKDMKSYTSAACGLVISHLTYPFALVTNIMAANGSGLRAVSPPRMPIYDSWQDCWNHLTEIGQLKRGSSMFWRYYLGPMTFRDGRYYPAFRPSFS